MVDIECTMETESETIIDCLEKIRNEPRFLDDIIKIKAEPSLIFSEEEIPSLEDEALFQQCFRGGPFVFLPIRPYSLGFFL